MDILSVFFIAVGIAMVLFAFVALTFFRYRFKGDLTPVILVVFGLLFLAAVINTLSLANL